MRFVLKTNYGQDVNLFLHDGQRFWYGLLALAVLLAPLVLDRFYLGEFAYVYIWAIAGVGLMLLVGYTGLVSLGHAAFLAIGAYAHAWLLTQGVPFILSVPLATAFCAVIGYIVGLPALRMTGIYLAIATLAFERIAAWVIEHWESVTGGHFGMRVPDPMVFGMSLDGPVPFYYLCLGILILSLFAALNLLRSPTGRAFIAVRDSEVSAESMGINLARTKCTAFALSAAFTGLAGTLFSHRIGYLAPDAFTVQTSIQLLLMVVVGGLGSLQGVVYGAIFLGLLPQAIAIGRDVLPQWIGEIPGLEPGIFGLILVLFLIFEPLGIHGRWVKVRLWFDQFPLYRRATYKRQRSYLRTERVR